LFVCFFVCFFFVCVFFVCLFVCLFVLLLFALLAFAGDLQLLVRFLTRWHVKHIWLDQSEDLRASCVLTSWQAVTG